MRLDFKLFVTFCLTCALCLSVWLRPVKASSSSLSESRISQLEFKVRSLQTQINQMQGQSPSVSASSPISPPEFRQPLNELSVDEQFDNLATLVIEINQRVMRLEEQISATAN